MQVSKRGRVSTDPAPFSCPTSHRRPPCWVATVRRARRNRARADPGAKLRRLSSGAQPRDDDDERPPPSAGVPHSASC